MSLPKLIKLPLVWVVCGYSGVAIKCWWYDAPVAWNLANNSIWIIGAVVVYALWWAMEAGQ